MRHTAGVAAAEFFTPLGPNERLPWISFIERLELWEISRPIAIQAGAFRCHHAGLGVTLSTTNSLIAAVAVGIVATLVTRDITDIPMKEVSSIRLDP